MTDARELRDEDRLPWLETVEEDEPERSNVLRWVLIALAGLALAAAAIWGFARWQDQRLRGGSGELIEAQEGDYKVRPDDPGGLKVEGEGDAAIATSAGERRDAAIDLKAVPETPVSGRRAGPGAPQRGASRTSSDVPPSGGRLAANAPMAAPRASVPGAASGGSLVQLGAFPSEAAANAAWSAVAKRFTYVSTLGKSVQPVTTAGRTLYRLRVNAGSANAAADVCGRLKVAGETCFVTS